MTIEINDPTIESFLKEQLKERDINLSEYIKSIVLKEIDTIKIKKDLQIIEQELEEFHKDTSKLKSAYSLLDEL